jgi:hypothetical protein
MFTKVLLSVSIAAGFCIGAAAPATAEDESNVFGTLTCSCSQTAPPGSSALSEINRGLQHARSAELAGPTAPIARG